MILFWFVLGIITILCIARYNEDEKLFWKLFISFIGAYGAAAVALQIAKQQKQDKVEYVTSAPMQVLSSESYVCTLADPSTVVTNEVCTSVPASKDMQMFYTNPILSKVAGGARDQPFEFFDTS